MSRSFSLWTTFCLSIFQMFSQTDNFMELEVVLWSKTNPVSHPKKRDEKCLLKLLDCGLKDCEATLCLQRTVPIHQAKDCNATPITLGKRNQAARSNCSSSRRCHRSAHRGSTWFLLSRYKYRHFSMNLPSFSSIFFLIPLLFIIFATGSGRNPD